MSCFLIVDLEATCWPAEASYRRDQMETIEIGAVMLDEDFKPVDEFSSFVKPVSHPRLSEYCTSLTSIEQANVDMADPFGQVYWRFIDWINQRSTVFCSWGFYDVSQIQVDCQRSGVPFPVWIEANHINLKQEFARWRGVRRCGMTKALNHLGLEVEGTHHRGIDDARNIARIATKMLPEVLV